MQPRRFGKNVKLPATAAIKHQIRTLMLADAIEAERAERAEADPSRLPKAHAASAP
jgi:hypothetical protein